MSTRTFPFTAWRLMPSFNTKGVTIVGTRRLFGTEYFLGEKNQTFSPGELFDSEKAAIDSGFQRLGDQEAHIKKLQAGVKKKREALLAAQSKMVNAEMAKAGAP